MSSIRYRPEIDGLRAIAVTAVLIYHAEFDVLGAKLLPGGFLGVDIFFVISGYLITFILLREMRADRFSFRDFYDRRARRILPALLTVSLVSLPFAWGLLLPQALEEFSQSVIATLLFVANLFFWSQDSYLAEPSQFKPMLHMWTLGVEEQFYVFFPILLLALWRFARRHLLPVMLAGLAASLALAEWGSHAFPDASFYLLPTRAWEFLGGAILAKLQLDERLPEVSRGTAALPALGAALLIIPLFLYTDRITHPGILTAAPVAGTMLLIVFARARDVVSSTLSSRPFVAIGLISYSLYLWHQPVLVFARISSVEPLTDLLKVALLAMCVLLAAATWFLVEQPFRRRNRLPLKVLLPVVGTTSTGLIAACGVILLNQGFASRYPPIISDVFAQGAIAFPSDEDGMCMRRSVADGNYCTFGSDDAPVRYFSVGDSHMQRFSMPLIAALEKRNAQLVSLEVGTCPYGPGLETARNNLRPVDCVSEVNETRRRILLSAPPSLVFLGARMPWYLGDEPESDVEFILRPASGEGAGEEASEVVAHNLRAAVMELLDHGHSVVLVYPVPPAPTHPARYLAQTMPKTIADAEPWLGRKSNWLTTPYAEFKRVAAGSYAIYDAIPDHPRLLRVYPERLLCNTLIKGACITHDAKMLYYEDDDHLSFEANGALLTGIFERVDSMWPEVAS